MSRTAVILLAAGSSRRMAGAVDDKILAPLGGRPVFSYSAAAFMASGVADFYAVVYRDRPQMLQLSAYAPTPSVLVAGGRERQDSVARALAELPDDIAHVFIHDCARPLIRPEQLVALHKIVRREGAVVLAHRVTDTIKQSIKLRGQAAIVGIRANSSAQSARNVLRAAARDSNNRGLTPSRLKTVDRSRLWAMETPQVFSHDLIARAYARVQARGLRVTDDAAAVELLRHPLALLENPHPNPKLTTPADLDYVEFLLRRRAQS